MSFGRPRYRLARASALAGEEVESVGHEELEAWRERLAVVAAHFAGAASVEARPFIFASLPDRTRFSAVEAKEFCSLWLQAALLPIDSTRLPAFFEFLRADLKAHERTGQALPLPELAPLPPPEPRRPFARRFASKLPTAKPEPAPLERGGQERPSAAPLEEREPNVVAAVTNPDVRADRVREQPQQPPGAWGAREEANTLWRSQRSRGGELQRFLVNEYGIDR